MNRGQPLLHRLLFWSNFGLQGLPFVCFVCPGHALLEKTYNGKGSFGASFIKQERWLCSAIPGHALHEKGLQKQRSVGTLFRGQEPEVAVVLRINKLWKTGLLWVWFSWRTNISASGPGLPRPPAPSRASPPRPASFMSVFRFLNEVSYHPSMFLVPEIRLKQLASKFKGTRGMVVFLAHKPVGILPAKQRQPLRCVWSPRSKLPL